MQATSVGQTTRADEPGHQLSRPLHVLHLVFSLQPGGMEFGVVKVVNGLDQARFRSSICSTRGGGQLKALVRAGIAVHEMERRDGNDPRLVWQLYRLFRRERPDVVHTHGWGTMVEGLVAARLAGVPVLVHGEHGTLQLRRHQRWLQRRCWARIDQVLSVSSRLAERMARETGFPSRRIQTIRNGVDLSRFQGVSRQQSRRCLGLGDDDFVIGAVGRLVPVKNHASLLEAVKLLHDSGVIVTLVIAGDGPLRGELEARAAALGIADRVRLLGHRADVENVLASLDVFVLCSTSEGLPNTVLEAMATGVPVVSTRVGGAEEVVEENTTGLLVPPASPEALSEALAAVWRDDQWRTSMGIAGRLRVEREFALPQAVSAYENLYLRLARGAGSNRS